MHLRLQGRCFTACPPTGLQNPPPACVQYMHIPHRDQCNWLRERIETKDPISYSAERKTHILDRLAWSEMCVPRHLLPGPLCAGKHENARRWFKVLLLGAFCFRLLLSPFAFARTREDRTLLLSGSAPRLLSVRDAMWGTDTFVGLVVLEVPQTTGAGSSRSWRTSTQQPSALGWRAARRSSRA